MSATMEAAPLRLYSIFHLNLAYSSIELEQRAKLIERCYWPLLRLAKEFDFFPGVELSGYTLSVANEIAPDWVDELRRLVQEGRCELIGSGYGQFERLVGRWWRSGAFSLLAVRARALWEQIGHHHRRDHRTEHVVDTASGVAMHQRPTVTAFCDL